MVEYKLYKQLHKNIRWWNTTCTSGCTKTLRWLATIQSLSCKARTVGCVCVYMSAVFVCQNIAQRERSTWSLVAVNCVIIFSGSCHWSIWCVWTVWSYFLGPVIEAFDVCEPCDHIFWVLWLKHLMSVNWVIIFSGSWEWSVWCLWTVWSYFLCPESESEAFDVCEPVSYTHLTLPTMAVV